MKYLFSQTGLKLLESLTFTPTLYAFDFDGTLAPIVRKPDEVAVSRKTLQLMEAINSRSVTAVISGRSVADLRKLVSWEPRYLIGNHGMEGLPSRRSATPQTERVCAQWKARLRGAWGQRIRDPGVMLEDKTHSLALHFRRSRNKKEAKRALLDLVGVLDPAPRLILGKSVINLVPAGAPHKGVAILELMLHLGLKSAFYVGDDDTDEDVFSLPDARILTARVVRGNR